MAFSPPFGMLMPERSVGSANYRYAFNGMELDNEVSGNGNSYTTEFRQYDPRLGRWKSLDPLMAKYPMMSPYVAFNNNPIYFTDIYGLEGDGPDEGGGAGDKGGPKLDPSFYNSEQYIDKLSAMKRSGGITKADHDQVMDIIQSRGYAIESDIALLTTQQQSEAKEWHRGSARSKNDLQIFVRDNHSYFADPNGGTASQIHFRFSPPMKEIIPASHLRPIISRYTSADLIGTLPILPIPQPNIGRELIPYEPRSSKKNLSQDVLDNALKGGFSTFGIKKVGSQINLIVNPSSVKGSVAGIGSALNGFSFTSITFNVTIYIADNNVLSKASSANQNAAKKIFVSHIRSQIANSAGVSSSKVNVIVNFTKNPANNSFGASFKP